MYLIIIKYDLFYFFVFVGKLPKKWTEENLYEKHSSRPYNPNIAHVFYLAGHIESWGRGIEKICNSCKANNFPLPIYHLHPSDIMIQFNASKELVIEDNDRVTDRVTDSMMQILNLLREDPAYSYHNLADKTRMSRKTVAVNIRKLKELNYITRIGSDRKGYWQINNGN